MPEISVVIPVYNVEKFLAECLDSVVAQTFRDIEIICVNDGSTDRSPEILREYAAKDERFRIVDKENAGVSAARNDGIRMAEGKYILLVDSDDSIAPSLCEKTWETAEREKADMTFFFLFSDDQSRNWSPLRDFLKRNDFTQIDRATLLTQMAPVGKLWKRRFLLENEIRFPEGIGCGEDIVVHWNALLHSPEMAVVLEDLYYYRNNPDSAMNDFDGPRMFDIFPCYKAVEKILYASENRDAEWEYLYRKNKLESYYYHYYLVAKSGKAEMADMIRKSIDAPESDFLAKTPDLHPVARAFYGYLNGSLADTVKFGIFRLLMSGKRCIKSRVGFIRRILKHASSSHE